MQHAAYMVPLSILDGPSAALSWAPRPPVQFPRPARLWIWSAATWVLSLGWGKWYGTHCCECGRACVCVYVCVCAFGVGCVGASTRSSKLLYACTHMLMRNIMKYVFVYASYFLLMACSTCMCRLTLQGLPRFDFCESDPCRKLRRIGQGRRFERRAACPIWLKQIYTFVMKCIVECYKYD